MDAVPPSAVEVTGTIVNVPEWELVSAPGYNRLNNCPSPHEIPAEPPALSCAAG